MSLGPLRAGVPVPSGMRHEDIESWLIGHACEIAAASGASVERLRESKQSFKLTAVVHAKLAFTDRLASVGL